MCVDPGYAECAAGTYSATAASGSCTACPAGSTSSLGATSCTCLAGYSTSGSGTTLVCTGTQFDGLNSGGRGQLADGRQWAALGRHARAPRNQQHAPTAPTPRPAQRAAPVRLTRHLARSAASTALDHKRSSMQTRLPPCLPACTECFSGTYSGDTAGSCTACPAASTSCDGATTCSCNAGYFGTGSGSSLVCTGTQRASTARPATPRPGPCTPPYSQTLPGLLCTQCSMWSEHLQPRRCHCMQAVPDRQLQWFGGEHVHLHPWQRPERLGRQPRLHALPGGHLQPVRRALHWCVPAGDAWKTQGFRAHHRSIDLPRPASASFPSRSLMQRATLARSAATSRRRALPARATASARPAPPPAPASPATRATASTAAPLHAPVRNLFAKRRMSKGLALMHWTDACPQWRPPHSLPCGHVQPARLELVHGVPVRQHQLRGRVLVHLHPRLRRLGERRQPELHGYGAMQRWEFRPRNALF